MGQNIWGKTVKNIKPHTVIKDKIGMNIKPHPWEVTELLE